MTCNDKIEHNVDYLIKFIRKKNSLLNIICDLDETIFNPLESWKRMLEEVIDSSIDIEQVKVAGNLDRYFEKSPHFQDIIFSLESLRKNNKIYENSSLVSNVVSAINKINKEKNIDFSGYLSARPTDVFDVTIDELKKNLLPQVPIILRDKDIDFYSSVEWKTGVIQELLNNTQSYIAIIDDNIDLAKYLLNNIQHPNRLIIILFSGPLSSHSIAEQRIISNESKNFYVEDWYTIPNRLISIVKDKR